jgi:hypothetical protein
MSDLRVSRDRLDEGRDYDPYRLSSPRIVILTMAIFLIIVAFLAAILMRQIHTFFVTNPGLNGLILLVLLIGILLAFGQVLRLLPEIRWVNSFRDGDREGTARPPVLLAPMRALIGRRQSMALSTASMRSILDSIATRLDESRDISRYLIGLLVFLGLLGTFWGLLETVGSIGRTIQTLDPNSGSTGDVLDALKAGLQAPLSGMGTAFSSELENWLSSVTDLGSDTGADQNGGTEEIRVLADRLQNLHGGDASTQRTTAALANLAEGIQGLVKNMRSEQQIMRDWVEKQADEQKAIRQTLDRLTKAIGERSHDRKSDRSDKAE